MREVAWRLFASEYNDATLEMDGGGERAPSYVVTPLGAKVNRVFVVGVITDVENVGTDIQPMWRARVSDPTGTFRIYAGQYQPEAAATLSKLKPPVFGAIVGKSRVYSPEAGSVFTSIRPERIKAVDETVRDYWILEACQSLRKRLDTMAEAMKMNPPTKEGLAKIGVKEAIADGIVQAVNHYGTVDLSRYTAMLAEGLRYLLPEYREPADPGEATPEAAASVKEEPPREPDETDLKVLEIIAALDKDGKGAPWEGILEAAVSKSVAKDALEESINSLRQDQHLRADMPTFAPHLRHRRIFGARSVRRSIRLRPSFPDAAPPRPHEVPNRRTVMNEFPVSHTGTPAVNGQPAGRKRAWKAYTPTMPPISAPMKPREPMNVVRPANTPTAKRTKGK